MPPSIDDRFVITANAQTVEVVITIGDVSIAVKMPSITGIESMTEEQIRQTALRQLRRVLEVAREELE